MPHRLSPLPPGSTVGILGGGQLGRMLAQSAAELGMKCHIFCPDEASPAFDAAAAFTVADYDDEGALGAFAAAVDVVTYEFENVSARAAEAVSRHCPLHPDARALGISQDRLLEKRFIEKLGIATAPYAPAGSPDELEAAIGRIGTPAILKTRRFGYDGKGQVRLDGPGGGGAAWTAIAGAPAILEGFIDFEREISVIAARAHDGTVRAYEPGENVHRNHILDVTTVPCGLDDSVTQQALAIAAGILDGLDYIGVIGVELFVERSEAGPALRVNEIAPRVHNSGHWTMDACVTGQFEQHIRAICGWPLGSTGRLCGARMKNLIGDDVDAWLDHAAAPGAKVHIYGKSETRPGRKMGHVTWLNREGAV